MKNEYDAEFEQLETTGNGGMRWVSLLVIAMVVFGFFWLILYAYDDETEIRQTEMIGTISPEQESYKIKPEDAGGLAIENKDIESYQLMRKSPDVANDVDQVERLLPLAERPIIRNIPQDNNELQPIENAQNNVDAITKTDPNQPKIIPQAVVTDEVVSEQLAEPVDDVDSVINEVIGKQAAQIEAPSAVEKMQENNMVSKPVKAENANVAPVKVAQPKPAPAAPKITAPKIVAPAPVAVAKSGGSYIQFAALRSAADAARIWGELKAKHPELIPYAYYTEAVTTATGSTLYRLRAKGFAGRNQALNICNAIKSRGQDCLVSAN
jgi:hypothetical protein